MAHLMTFDEWKALLLTDCVAHDKSREFKSLDDYILHLLYNGGTFPSVAAIVNAPKQEGS